MIFGLKTALCNSLEKMEKNVFIRLKGAASILINETSICSIPAPLEETEGKGRFKQGEIKRLVVFAEAMSAGFSDSLDCIYNIWPYAEL